jgi:hypothetical protein
MTDQSTNLPNGVTDISGESGASSVVPISWLDIKEGTKCADQDCINKLITPIIKTILFKTYVFCCKECAEDYDDHLRRSYRKSMKVTK